MSKPQKSDAELIRMIRGAEAEREAALRYIYLESGWRQIARSIILGDRGSAADADDAVQEALIKLDNHVRNFRYREEGSLKNFFLGICRGRWYSARRSVKRLDYTDDPFKMDAVEHLDPAVLMLADEQKSIINELLKILDVSCREVLMLYKLSYSMEEITEQLALKNTNNARQKVHKCREKMRKLAYHHPAFSEYLKDDA